LLEIFALSPVTDTIFGQKGQKVMVTRAAGLNFESTPTRRPAIYWKRLQRSCLRWVFTRATVYVSAVFATATWL